MQNPNRFYTYAYLREDRTPYYIGKGQGKRIYQKSKREIRIPKDKSRIIFLKQNLSEEEAFKHEIYMIGIFGRIDLGTGILRNKTDGGDGSSGAIISEETRRKLSEAGRKLFGKDHPTYGKKWWNDGCGNIKFSKECPGENWIIGRGKKYSELSGRNGKKCYKNKTGMYSLSAEDKKELGRKTSSQVWECTITGHRSTPGGLHNYQKARGIDPSNRKRIS